MKYVRVLPVLILIHICSFPALSKTFDARSNAMGGIGVANAPLRTAVFHNPSLMSLGYTQNKKGEGESEMQFLCIDAEIHNIKEIINRANDFARNLNAFNNLTSLSLINAINSPVLGNVFDSLEQMAKVKLSRFELGATTSFAEQTSVASYALSVQRIYEFLLIPSIDKNELNVTALAQIVTNPSHPNLNSNIFLLYKVQTDYTIAFANTLKWISDNLHFGINLKYQTIQLGSFFPELNSPTGNQDVFTSNPIEFYNDRIDDADSYNNINADLGFVFKAHRLFFIGLTIKDLIPQTHKLTPRNGLELDYEVNTVPIFGMSYIHPILSLNAQVDVYPRRHYENITGTVGEIKDDSDDEQFLRLGLETNYEDTFFFRAGYRINFNAVEDEKSSFSAGFGFQPFSFFNFDIAIRLRNHYNFGVTFETGFSF